MPAAQVDCNYAFSDQFIQDLIYSACLNPHVRLGRVCTFLQGQTLRSRPLP
jgi:hypothetical protein